MTRIFIEDMELDTREGFSNQVTYAIDDLNNLDSKATSFTKTIVLPGTARNNSLLGNIFDINNSNFTFDGLPNVGYNFNASKQAKCRIEVNGLQIIKGVFRLLEIIVDGKFIEYEAAVFGELGGFITKTRNLRLEDLDFSAYDHILTIANIKASWDNYNAGAGYYYPLIDYGAVSTGAYGVAKKDYQFRVFRPAFFLREYMDKIITGAGYTWESSLFNTDFFKRIIIPNNAKQLSKISDTALDVSTVITQTVSDPDSLAIAMEINTTLGSFIDYGGANTFQYLGTVTLTGRLRLVITGEFYNSLAGNAYINLLTQNAAVSYPFPEKDDSSFEPYSVTLDLNLTINPGDLIGAYIVGTDPSWYYNVKVFTARLTLTSANLEPVLINLGETVPVNDTLPRGIFQKDFFASILKMFYLMVTEDKNKDKHLVIEPYVDFYETSNYLDWSNKLDRNKPIKVKPMSEVNARYYELKFKSDTDYYNDGYRKKYNTGYGDRIYDNGLDFAKETETVEVVFAATPLVGYFGEDKVVPAIYKKTNNIEESIGHVMRIMQAKKVEGVASWKIMNLATTLDTISIYPYAGHLDDPDAPNADINFGAPKELYFTLVTGDLSNNLFNAYYSPYLAEITDKDSRLLTGMFKLTQQDIYDLNFKRFIYIDGSLFRISKIEDYNTEGEDMTRVSLLKVIYTTY